MSLDAFGRQLREEVRRHTTLVCGVGIARTKTLAKLCNHAAKTWPATGGVVALDDGARLKKLMSILPVAEVWGVGHRTEKALATMGIKTVLDLARADTRLIRKTFGVVLERTVPQLRLRGDIDDLFVGKTLLHGDVLMWLMKTLLTSGCTNQRGAGQAL